MSRVKKVLTKEESHGNINLALRGADKFARCASGGIGRLAGFRCQCSQGRAGSTPASRTSSSQALYRLRRAFSFHCKAHRALILLLLASKPQPLCWVAVWVRRFAAVSSAKSALRPRSFLPLAEKNVIRPLPCSSFPTATRCAGLAVGRPPCGRHFLCPRSWEK